MTLLCVSLYRDHGLFMTVSQDGELRMLDMLGILFSSVMILIVVVRAVRLDSVQPWFQNVKRTVASPLGGRTRQE